MSRIVLSGYYGFGNAGDEAVLAAILASLRRQIPGAEYAVLSVDPAATTRLHDVPAFHRARPREVLAALRGCDLFISGGGSLLQDVTSLSSLLFYLAQIRLARMLRRPVMIYAQGIGPLLRPAARRLTARTLRTVNCITVRDAGSAALLRQIGLGGSDPPVEVTADPVFALAPAASEWAAREIERVIAQTEGVRIAPETAAAVRARAGGQPGDELPLLGISVREWPGLAAKLDLLSDVIWETSEAIGAVPVYFPLQASQDMAACRQLAARSGGVVLPGEYSPGEWMALTGRMQLFLGMRLHALIFAAAMGVPLVGLTYDPKVTALLARLGTKPAASLPDLDAAAVRQVLADTWNDRARRSVQLREAAEDLAAAAAVSAQRAADLLGAGGRSSRRGRSAAASF